MDLTTSPSTIADNVSTASPHTGDPEIWWPVHVVVMVVILALAFLGNTSICWIILTDAKLRSVPNTLVLNLAVCGLFTVLANGPLALLVLSGDSSIWDYGNAACQFNGFTTSVYGLASVLTLALISVNRYQMIRRSTGQFASWFNRSSIKILIGAVWGLSALLSFPPVVGWSRYEFILERAICTLKWSTEITYTVFVFTLGIILPFVVMVIAYGAIFRLVRKKFKRMRSHSTRRKDGSVVRDLSGSFGKYLTAAAQRNAARRGSGQQSGGPLQVGSVSAVSGASVAVSSDKHGSSVPQIPCNTISNGLPCKAILGDVGVEDQRVTPTPPTPISSMGHHLSPGLHNANKGTSWSPADAKTTNGSRFLEEMNNAPQCAPPNQTSLMIAVPVSYQPGSSTEPVAAASSVRPNTHPGVTRTVSAPPDQAEMTTTQPTSSTVDESEQPDKSKIVRKHKTNFGSFRPPKDDVRVTVMVCAVLTSFVLCWLPITVINFWESAWDGDVSPALNIFSVYMMFASSAINPLIYGMLNRNFRIGFRRFFCGFLSSRGACRCCLSTKIWTRQNRVSVINTK